ncbi:hypothetical protein [Algiphilus sp.]|uniref:hypothetical protein n=1 Tax=Algiphilus sp. TaxID=1872431 RepID=UPI0025B82243|nr:hypothetical protein [Algiphilus sp.]MCK5770944.1 hypothetical protein [Algiphilus sp.]
MSNVLMASGQLIRKNVHGKGFIAGQGSGVLTIDGTPAVGEVWLYERVPNSGKLIARTQSRSDGTYAIEFIPPERRYMVVGTDPDGVHNAVVADRITPALMPEFE